jgi:hypothetical protein
LLGNLRALVSAAEIRLAWEAHQIFPESEGSDLPSSILLCRCVSEKEGGKKHECGNNRHGIRKRTSLDQRHQYRRWDLAYHRTLCARLRK